MKFKIGDKVECIKSDRKVNDGFGKYGGSGWKEGLRFKVIEITDRKNIPIYWEGVDECGVYEPYLKFHFYGLFLPHPAVHHLRNNEDL